MAEFEQQLESILVADCGSTMTKIVLLDLVEGQYRFIAYAESMSTVNEPWEDVSVGIVDAIKKMQEITGRTFLDENGHLITPELDDQGIDRFLAVSSAAQPLRVILAGLVRDVSLSSARRAALSTYTDIVDTISLEQPPGRNQPRSDDEKINAIWHSSPDLVCVVGGTDGGVTTPVLGIVRDVVRVALYLMGESAPPVIYAGNARLAESVTKMFEGLTTVQIADNVRPLPDTENIGPAQDELEVMFYEQKINRIPGLEVLNSWTPSVILPTARASDYVIRFCERVWKSSKPALGVNVGSSTVTLNVCENGHPLTTIRTDLGVGYGLMGLLEQLNLDDIIRWLPFEISMSEARDRLMNQALRPQTIPQTREDLLLAHAAAREAIRLTLQDSLPGWSGQISGSSNRADGGMVPPCEPIIAGGALLTHVPHHGYATLILLDALQMTGISTLFLDEHNLVPSLGTVGAVDPLAVVQTLRNNGLAFLGAVAAPVGQAKQGDTVLTIKADDKSANMRVEVKYGSLETILLPTLSPGTPLELIPERGFDIGQGVGKSRTIKYQGGTMGLIIDARGRPIELSDTPETRRQQMINWLSKMTGEDKTQ